jgi:hypothetical protein
MSLPNTITINMKCKIPARAKISTLCCHIKALHSLKIFENVNYPYLYCELDENMISYGYFNPVKICRFNYLRLHYSFQMFQLHFDTNFEFKYTYK